MTHSPLSARTEWEFPNVGSSDPQVISPHTEVGRYRLAVGVALACGC
jgi:hypothetical protein